MKNPKLQNIKCESPFELKFFLFKNTSLSRSAVLHSVTRGRLQSALLEIAQTALLMQKLKVKLIRRRKGKEMAAVSTLTVVLTWHIATIKDTGVDSENIRNAVQMPIARIGRKDPTTRTASADISKVNLFPKF